MRVYACTSVCVRMYACTFVFGSVETYISFTNKILFLRVLVMDPKCKNCVSFIRESSTRRSTVTNSDLWIHQNPKINIRRRRLIKVYLIKKGTWKKTLLAKRRIRRKRSGWHRINLKDIIKYIVTRGGYLHIDLILQITCTGCKVSLSGINAPYFDLSEKSITKRKAHKSLKCTPGSTACCLDDFFINLQDYVEGLAEWIVLPKGINLGTCRGVCDSVHTVFGAHSGVVKAPKLKNSVEWDLCCVPKRYKSISTLFYNKKGEIIVRNIHDLVVSECACA